mgnify:CR=1 FL=1
MIRENQPHMIYSRSGCTQICESGLVILCESRLDPLSYHGLGPDVALGGSWWREPNEIVMQKTNGVDQFLTSNCHELLEFSTGTGTLGNGCRSFHKNIPRCPSLPLWWLGITPWRRLCIWWHQVSTLNPPLCVALWDQHRAWTIQLHGNEQSSQLWGNPQSNLLCCSRGQGSQSGFRGPASKASHKYQTRHNHKESSALVQNHWLAPMTGGFKKGHMDTLHKTEEEKQVSATI